MPITKHDQPVYNLTCDNEDCPGDNSTAIDDDGYLRLFESERAARDWGEANGWDVSPATGILCPADAAEAREQQEQAEDITAAIHYAMGDAR